MDSNRTFRQSVSSAPSFSAQPLCHFVRSVHFSIFDDPLSSSYGVIAFLRSTLHTRAREFRHYFANHFFYDTPHLIWPASRNALILTPCFYFSLPKTQNLRILREQRGGLWRSLFASP